MSRSLAWLGLVLVGCGSTPATSPEDAGVPASDSSPSDAQLPVDAEPEEDADAPAESVSFSEAEWEQLRQLAPDVLPGARPDPSNMWADDPAAAELGRVFFFEPAFSGELLDVDNDGGPNSLGEVGDTGRVSCGGCHIEQAAFADNRSTFAEISLGAGWTTRRTPSLLDVGQTSLVLWGGRHSTLHGQVFGPIENALEMNTSRLYVATYIADHYRQEYEAVFGAESLAPLLDTERFVRLAPTLTGCHLIEEIDHPRATGGEDIYECHGMPGDGAEFDALSADDQTAVTRVVVNMGKAVAAYERTLACGPGRFDAFVHGDTNALTQSEQRGLKLFIGRAGCVDCHSGPFMSDQDFHNVGHAQGTTREGITNNNDRGAAADLLAALDDELSVAGPFSDGDDGRLPSEIPDHYEGAFKTPTLRCVSQRPTFMHTGLLSALNEVVSFFDRGGDPGGFPGTNELEPLGLTREERADLVELLEAL